MRKLLSLLPLALLFSAGGCVAITGCDEDVQTFESTYDSGFYDVYATTILKQWQDKGYDCKAEGIYGSSSRIGTKWTCTGCP